MRVLPWFLCSVLLVAEWPVVFVGQFQVFAVVGFLAFFADGLPDEPEAGCSVFVQGGIPVCRWAQGDVPDGLPASDCLWAGGFPASVWQNL